MLSKERGSRLNGAIVIALEEGLKLGRASEVYIDQQAKQILGISYKTGILGTDNEIYVGFEDILKFSSDVVIVSSQAACKELPAGIEEFGLRAWKGNRITTQSGNHIAVLADIVIDRADGKIMEILLPENLKLEIDIGDVVFGRDLIMVPAEYELATTPIEPESRDFIDRVFGNTAFSEKVREGYAEAKTSVRNNVNREKVVQSLKSGSRMAKDTMMRTSQAIQLKVDQIMKKREAEKSGDASDTADTNAPMDAETHETADHAETSSESGYESARDEQHVEKP